MKSSRAEQYRASEAQGWWAAANRFLLILIFLGLAMAMICMYIPLFQHQSQFEREEKLLGEAIAREERLRSRPDRELLLLETDREYLEMVARERLDLLKQGETVFRLETSGDKEAPRP